MFKNFIISAKNFKNTKVICASALMAALYVALYAAKLQITPQLRISFSFVPHMLAGWLLGAVPAMAVGAAGDIIGSLLFPTGAYFPGFTLTAILSGLVYGACLYHAEKPFFRIIAARAIVNLALHSLLGSYWVSLITGKGFWVYFSARTVKNICILPIEVLVMYIIIKILSSHGIRKMYK